MAIKMDIHVGLSAEKINNDVAGLSANRAEYIAKTKEVLEGILQIDVSGLPKSEYPKYCFYMEENAVEVPVYYYIVPGSSDIYSIYSEAYGWGDATVWEEINNISTDVLKAFVDCFGG